MIVSRKNTKFVEDWYIAVVIQTNWAYCRTISLKDVGRTANSENTD